MGSKISKAVRPHVKTGTVAAPAGSDNHSIDFTTSRQDQTPVCISNDRLPELPRQLSHDDNDISTSTARIMSAPRRNSEPSLSSLQPEGTVSARTQNRLDNFEQFLVERQMMAIDMENDTSFTNPAASQPTAQPSTPAPQCLFCCKDLPKDGDEAALTPCRHCQSPCCTSCVKNMFVEACRDATRMPPRCCVPFSIHVAKPYLSADEIALFRVKYEEWCTPNPIYCPVPTCSTFIPDRLLPQHFRNKSEARGDSGIGTPTPEAFTCPTCEAGICVGCQQQAHPGSMCTIEEFGIDVNTAALLKAWGYKRCPKCGNGVKRMFGCNHMECRCGANFCWVCLNNINECEGGCRDEGSGSESDLESDSDSESESNSVPDEEANTAEADNVTSEECASVAVEDNTTVDANQEEASQLPTRHVPNLDGGGSNFWADSSLYFGEEPTDDGTQAVWSCNHSFMPYTVPFETALASKSSDMECVKCWNTIHPSIDTTLAPVKNKVKPSHTAGTNGVRPRQTARRGRPFRGGRGAYMPPRGLQRGNATIGMTIGTAPHLSTLIVPPTPPLPSLSRRQGSPMEDVQLSEQNTNSHGDITTTTSLGTSRTSSQAPSASNHQHDKVFKRVESESVFATPPPTSSLAHECKYCYALVCQSCRDDVTAEQEAKQKREDAATQSEHISGGPEQRAAVVTAGQGDGAIAAEVEVIEDESDDMPYSLFD